MKEEEGEARGDLILLDNDARIVELLSWFLGNKGFTVRTASNFEELRLRIGERSPGLLISDVDLGAESAVVELPKLSAEGLLPPTLVVSGFLDESVRASLFAVPEVMDSLPKPFEFPELASKVEACLRGEVEPARAEDAGFANPEPPRAEHPKLEPTGPEDDEGWIEITPGG